MIKSRMQTDGFSPADGQKYKSTLDCVRTVWRTEGIGAFTRGLGPTLIRYAMALRLYFSHTYDFCLAFRPRCIVHPLQTGPRSLDSSWLSARYIKFSTSQASSRHTLSSDFTVLSNEGTPGDAGWTPPLHIFHSMAMLLQKLLVTSVLSHRIISAVWQFNF